MMRPRRRTLVIIIIVMVALFLAARIGGPLMP